MVTKCCIFPCSNSCSQHLCCCIARGMNVTPYQSEFSLTSVSDGDIWHQAETLAYSHWYLLLTCLCAPSLEDLSDLFTRLPTSSFSYQSLVSLQVIKRCSDLSLEDIWVLISCWIKMQLYRTFSNFLLSVMPEILIIWFHFILLPYF